jgi:hypothetical protein
MFDDAMISSDAVRRADRRGTRAPRPAGPTVAWVAMGVGCLSLVTCATGIKRDLSAVPVGQVGFDDLCGLQGYFDAIGLKNETPPELIDAADIEGRSKSGVVRGGRARFAFETDFQLATVRRVLDENWNDLPSRLGVAHQIQINVNWSERAGLRRVANNSDPELVVDGIATSLPYHVCLSELLFGEPLYRQRRELLGLGPQPPRSPAFGGAPPADAGVPSGPASLTSSSGVTPSPSAASSSAAPAAGGPAEAASPKTDRPKTAPPQANPLAVPTIPGKKD